MLPRERLRLVEAESRVTEPRWSGEWGLFGSDGVCGKEIAEVFVKEMEHIDVA